MNVKPVSRLDHLVVAADTLGQGVQWCEATLGVTPGPGGEHPLMGTHNRLLRIDTPRYPRSFLEIIAINPAAPDPGRRRWFDMDSGELRAAVHQQPRLVHFVAATQQATMALHALRKLGLERGPLLHAQRLTPTGLLEWRISVRKDGQRLFYGGLPTSIQWGEVHPVDSMPESGLQLQSLHMAHPRPADLREAHTAIGLQGVAVEQGAPNLVAVLVTPRGTVTLESKGI